MQKLKCKICDFESGNLFPHLVEKHGGEAGAKEYGRQHGKDAIIHPDLQNKFLKFSIGSSEALVRSDVPVSLKTFIPKLNENYQFQTFASDVLLDLTEEKSVPSMLTGHTGTGKTSLYEQIAARLNQPLLRVNVNGQTTISDFVGLWTVKGGETVWVDGALPWCMKNGVWLIVDEIDFAESAILSVLNSVLEVGGSLVLKEKGDEVVRPNKNFKICATANTAGCMTEWRHLYQGTNILNDAFIDRWRLYVVDYLPEDAEAKVLQAIKGMTPRVAKHMCQVANAIRKSFIEEDLQNTFSTRRLLDWGYLLTRHRHLKAEAPLRAAEAAIFSKVSREDKVVIEGIIQRVLRSRREP